MASDIDNTSTPVTDVDRFERHLHRAVRAADFGDRLTDSLRPSTREPAMTAALALYRAGVFWALTAETTGDLPEDIESAATSAPHRLAAGPELSKGPLRDRTRTRYWIDGAEPGGIEELETTRRLLRNLIGSLERSRPSPRRIAQRLLVKRALIAAALVSALLLLLAGAALYRHRDLAAGKPWTASSTYPGCDFDFSVCDGRAVGLFFHTREDDSPWVRVDLGEVHSVSSIMVLNRLDCCQDRAVPLILEVSTDGQKYVEVARRTAIFETWNATFHAVDARYVRARVPRRTVFHLHKIAVR